MEAHGLCPAHPLCLEPLGTFPPDVESLPEQPVVVVDPGHSLPLPLLVMGGCLPPPCEPEPLKKLPLCLKDGHSLCQAVFSTLKHHLPPDSKCLLL